MPVAVGMVLLVGVVVSALAVGALHEALPVLGLVVVVVAGLVVGSAGRGPGEGVLAGLVGCSVLVAVTAWVGVGFHHVPWGMVVEGLWRGASAITYANAAAGFLAMMAVVSFGRLACSPSRSMRLVCWGLTVGLLVTMSRAGIGAALVGLVVVGAGVGWGRLGRALLSVLPGTLLAVAGVLPGLLGDSPARPLEAIAALTVGLGVVLWCRSTATALALTVVCVLAVGAVGALGGLGGASDQLARTRLVPESADRGDEWHAALDQFAARPVTGQGPGRATFTWRADDGR